MGYTHYYQLTSKPADADKRFTHWASGVLVILNQAVSDGMKIADSTGKVKFGWIADNNKVAFNGLDEESHETFYLSARSEPGDFNFCKTAYKPYDAAVTASLLLLKKIYGEHVRISSDGVWGNWTDGAKLYERALNEKPVYPFDEVEVHA